MKKLFSLILALCMVCMLIPAVAEDSMAGEWYTNFSGVSMVLVLGEDGSAQLSMPGTEKNAAGTWTLDGEKFTLTLDDSPAEGTYVDGTITLSEGEMSMVFTREKPEEIQIAEVNPAAAAEEFEGTWAVAYVGYNGMVIDPSASGQEMPGLVVENGAMRFTGDSSMSQAFGTNSIPLAYADGALSMSVALGETSYGLKLEMLQDGMLALTATMGTTDVYMYFVKAAAEEPAA